MCDKRPGGEVAARRFDGVGGGSGVGLFGDAGCDAITLGWNAAKTPPASEYILSHVLLMFTCAVCVGVPHERARVYVVVFSMCMCLMCVVLLPSSTTAVRD